MLALCHAILNIGYCSIEKKKTMQKSSWFYSSFRDLNIFIYNNIWIKHCITGNLINIKLNTLKQFSEKSL